MLITDEQVAALRAYLVGDSGEWVRLHGWLVQSGGLDGYGEFVYTAFVTAVRQRFSPSYSRADVIRYVARVRSVLSDRPEMVAPRAAENLIRRALNEPVSDDLDQEIKVRAQLALLAVLISDARLEGSELDEFLDEVRTVTGQWWST